MTQQWESWVERQIREATERGEFDNLPGTGKPLDLGNPDDPDWWIKRLVQREGIDTSQALHPTLALRREAKTYPAALADLREEHQVREVVRDFNRRVIKDRRRPVQGAAMPPVAPRLDVEEMVAAWRAIRAARAAAPEPGVRRGATDPSRASARQWWRRWRLLPLPLSLLLPRRSGPGQPNAPDTSGVADQSGRSG